MEGRVNVAAVERETLADATWAILGAQDRVPFLLRFDQEEVALLTLLTVQKREPFSPRTGLVASQCLIRRQVAGQGAAMILIHSPYNCLCFMRDRHVDELPDPYPNAKGPPKCPPV